jgi:hypothetical protein
VVAGIAYAAGAILLGRKLQRTRLHSPA